MSLRHPGVWVRCATYISHECMFWNDILRNLQILCYPAHHFFEFSLVWVRCVTCVGHMCALEWLRLVGSFKSQVSIAEYSLFHRALLQKRTMILRSLLIVATPYANSRSSSISREIFWNAAKCGSGVWRVWVSCVLWNDTLLCATWRIHMCDMTQSYVWCDSFICVTWLTHMRDMTYSYEWHDSFVCVTCLIHMCEMTHSYVWHDSFICVS